MIFDWGGCFALLGHGFADWLIKFIFDDVCRQLIWQNDPKQHNNSGGASS